MFSDANEMMLAPYRMVSDISGLMSGATSVGFNLCVLAISPNSNKVETMILGRLSDMLALVVLCKSRAM